MLSIFWHAGEDIQETPTCETSEDDFWRLGKLKICKKFLKTLLGRPNNLECGKTSENCITEI